MPSPTGRAPAQEVAAAGAVVVAPRWRVLLVHRPKYDDWSFPKGKLDPGEHALTAAVREVQEETGLRVRLGMPLAGQRYAITAGVKQVHYWMGRPVGDGDISGYRPNDEIGAVRWVDADQAPDLLTYERDVRTLEAARTQPRKTRTLIVLRHAVAQTRKSFGRRDDRGRPLLLAGRRQAAQLAPMLDAYGVQRVVSSSSLRCVDTVAPYARLARRPVEQLSALSEEVADPELVTRLTHRLVDDLVETPSRRAVSVLCTHRPVLPWVCAALGMADPHLQKGEMLVVHLAGGAAIACERYQSGRVDAPSFT